MTLAMRRLLKAAWVFACVAKAGAAVQLTEIMASSHAGLLDENGAPSDWIELHNSGLAAVDLRGWHLTDDPLRARRWEFPSVVVPAGGYLVVFASGKDRSSSGSELHTDFSLASEGEYLALTDPAGQEADEFAPGYPPQVTNVSWGLVPGAVMGSHAHFYQPTPGAPNITASRASDPPVISETSRTFVAPFGVTLTSPQAGAQIFFTLDGTQPTTSSAVYSSPLTIIATTKLRAAAVSPGLAISLTAGAEYLQLAPDAVPADSNLPLMIIDNFNAGRPDGGTGAVWMVFEPAGTNGRAALTSPPAFASSAFIKVRGSSTANASKFSLAVEARNEAGGDRDFPVLGLPPDSDWVLGAPFEFDRALIRNPLMYALGRDAGRYAARTRQVELFLNTGGGPVSGADYFGVYTLTEKIKHGPDRVEVAQISPLDNSGAAVTGGYILKIDRADPGETGFTAAGQTLFFVDPDEPQITAPQKTWLAWYLNNWRTALNAQDFFDPHNGYAKWGDPASFIDHHILNVAAKNVDALRLSAYFYKDRLGRLTAGPLWDFDRSLESTDARDNNFNTWRGETGDLGTDFFRHPWYNEMFRDQNFWQQWIDRFDELRHGPLSDTHVQATVDAQAAELTEAVVRNFQRWSDRSPGFGGWSGEVAHLRSWFTSRLNWMDLQFTRPPVANTPGGPVPPGFALTLSSPSLARPGAVIYYTTDGSDPRVFDVTTGQQIVTETFITATHPVRVHLPSSDIGTAWRGGGTFDDSAWWTGVQGVGFDDTSDYNSFIGFNLEPPPPERRMKGVVQSCYIRCHFAATAAQIAPLTFLKLRVRCDDGMAAWLNGTKLPVSIREPSPLLWNSGATSNTADTAAVQFTDFIIPNPQSLLRDGDNVLAIHGLNYLLTSTDFLIQCELHGGYVPADAPEIAPQAVAWTGPLTITETTHLIARTYDPAGPFTPWPYTGAGSGRTPVGSHWSAPLRLSLLSGTVPAAASNLAVVEIMYHPGPLTAAEIAAGFTDRDEFEYIVLQNTGTMPVDMTGMHFTSGITFTMALGPQCVLAPGARGILVRNPAAFALRHAPGLNVLGEYKDKLNNAGEILTLLAANGSLIFLVPWDDGAGWPQEADGTGYSLVRSPAGPAAKKQGWRRSLDLAGEAHSPAALGFAAWQDIYFPAGGSGSDPQADPDFDGMSNALEYAAATHPNSSEDAAPPVARRLTSDGQPVVEITNRRRPGTGLWILESSADLSIWVPSPASPSVELNSDGSETLTWRVRESAARACYRARVELP